MKKIKTEEKNDKEIKKNIFKEIDKKVSTIVFVNLLIAIFIMAYFCIMSLVYKDVLQNGIINIVKISTMVFLLITIILIELAYKKESKIFLVHAFEAIALATHSLTTMHIVKIYNFDFQNYILASSYVFSIYYVLKTIVINTKARKDYLKGLSDIPEIIQKDKPTIKEAVKKEKADVEETETKETNFKVNKKEKKEKQTNNPNDKLASLRARIEKMKEQENIRINETKEVSAPIDEAEEEKEVSVPIEEVEETEETEDVKEVENVKEETAKEAETAKEDKKETKKPKTTKKSTSSKSTTSKSKTTTTSTKSKTTKPKTTQAKTTKTATKKKAENKEDKKEEIEAPKPKKRGRPKKEVKIDD